MYVCAYVFLNINHTYTYIQVSYTTAIIACNVSDEDEKVLRLFNEMRAKGVSPIEATFGAAIKVGR